MGLHSILKWLCIVAFIHPVVMRVGHDHGDEGDVMEIESGDCGSDNLCSVSSEDISVSWRNDKEAAKVHFEMAGETIGYVALGFSRDKKMGNDSVIHCDVDSNNVVTVAQSYNEPYHVNVLVNEPDAGLSNVEATYINGILSCNFSRDHQVASDPGHIFDLTHGQYYILLAKGPALSSGKIQEHTFQAASKKQFMLTAESGGAPPSGRAGGRLVVHLLWLIGRLLLCVN